MKHNLSTYQKMNDPYWYKLMKEENSIYIQLNSVTNKENQTLSDFQCRVKKAKLQKMKLKI